MSAIQTTQRWRIFVAVCAAFAAFGLAGCGEEPSVQDLVEVAPSATACQPGLAQIEVGDGFLEVLCGCASPSTGAGVIVGAPIASAASFTCYVPAGTIVMWQVLGTQLWHQIVPLVQTGPGSFPSGQLILPQDPDRTSVAQFTATGTYGFEDLMNTGLQGEIIVP